MATTHPNLTPLPQVAAMLAGSAEGKDFENARGHLYREIRVRRIRYYEKQTTVEGRRSYYFDDETIGQLKKHYGKIRRVEPKPA